jgi:hypothetical protein
MLLPLLGLAGGVLLVVGLLASTRLPSREGLRSQASRPLLPDLVMGAIPQFLTGRVDDRWHLRFSAIFVNQGPGEFLIRADRANVIDGRWSLAQEIVDADGGYIRQNTGGSLTWGGDGHSHWHVRGVQAHRLVRPSDGKVMGEVVKNGFCFFDTDKMVDLPSTPAQAKHRSADCGTLASTGLEMGLSVGWGDEYPWDLLDQNIPIDDVPDGRYRVEVDADPDDWFRETDEANNRTCTLIDLSTDADGFRRVDVAAPQPKDPCN